MRYEKYEEYFRKAYYRITTMYGAAVRGEIKPPRGFENMIMKEIVSERTASANDIEKGMLDQSLGVDYDLLGKIASYQGTLSGYYSILADIHGCRSAATRGVGK